ncbi:MAG TPA: hypothetical protein DIT04_10350 [Dysgonomonas sp.]|nr:hypothetical protein [Dysgonomonas sp.]
MDNITEANPQVNHGKTVRSFRHIEDLSQKELSAKMGISQKTLYKLEQEAIWSEEYLQKATKALEVPVEVLKNYDHQATVNNIISNNTFTSDNNSSSINSGPVTYNNTLDKVVDVYDRMMNELRGRIAQLEKQIAQK